VEVDRKARQPWITQEMINKMDGKREWKEYLESICDKIVEFQKNSHD
jgi:fructose-1,6-bisphosphatase